jgi:transglutaminase-like putative cysteine protease
MPLFKIHHVTQYQYDRPVRESANQIKIFPLQHYNQEVRRHDLKITNHPDVHQFTDFWGNLVGWFMLNSPHDELVIDSQLVVFTAKQDFDPFENASHANWLLIEKEVAGKLRLLDFSQPEPMKQKSKLSSIVSDIRSESDAPIHFIQRVSNYIFQEFTYEKGITTIETTVDDIMEHRSGVCQDFAHLMLQMLRMQGIPARYVSGYICPNRDGARGAGATHAWVEAWVPNIGWVGIDPTNNRWVSDEHVSLAVGRNFADCTPVKGTFKGPANQALHVLVSVSYEDGHVFEENTTVQLERDQPVLQKPQAKETQQQ